MIASDEETLAALKRGDESAFVELVKLQALMLRVARRYVRSPALAEEVVQETWLGVINGLESLRGPRLAEDLDLPHPHQPSDQPRRAGGAHGAVLVARRRGASRPSIPIASVPRATSGRAAGRASRELRLPEERLLARETLALVGEAIAGLPERQHLVILMRDIEGWSAGEVCEALEISEANQRVLLHRARSKVRRCLESYFDAGA